MKKPAKLKSKKPSGAKRFDSRSAVRKPVPPKKPAKPKMNQASDSSHMTLNSFPDPCTPLTDHGRPWGGHG